MNKERRIQQPSPVEAEILFFPKKSWWKSFQDYQSNRFANSGVSQNNGFLLSDPLLAKSHLKKTFDENLVALELDYPLKDKPNGLAELLDSARDGFLYCERSEEGNDEFPVMVKLNLPFCVNQRNWVDILGSCNGLVCIAPDEDTLFLFNPSTRESKRIPDPPSGFVPNGWSVYGFGFDFVNDDYKVVKVGCGTVCVYSLRTDSWRIVCSFPYLDNVSESGVLLNGTIHWMVSFEDGVDCRCVVAAFSLEEEVFSDMPAPDIVDTSFEFVVGFLMNREALLDVDGKLLLYNLEDDSYRYLVVDGIPAGDGFEADTYLETLLGFSTPIIAGGSPCQTERGAPTTRPRCRSGDMGGQTCARRLTVVAIGEECGG
ncbi:hypothetical protein CXB51_022185 [Gossypium anomalum]|uniref:F-box associated beta-propeller type 3 domain-containing protein n=1 Tax=Gossypium anomalum TaxID=47600 RepID=A0A8J6CQ42_9ROSI|nr:hypothetical protein CXB51_022185 [Gossypium anomalum]